MITLILESMSSYIMHCWNLTDSMTIKYIRQGLYEYVCPSWQDRARPVVDDYDVKSFGSTVPATVKNPNSYPLKLPQSSSGKLNGIVPPRYRADEFEKRENRLLLLFYYTTPTVERARTELC